MNKQGFGVIEIVIGSAIILAGIVSLMAAYTIYTKFALANDKNVQAAYLAEEGIEAVSFLRDSGWNSNIKNLSTTTTYYIAWSSSTWKSTTTPQYVDGTFLRSFAITDVSRDSGNDKISTTSSGVYYDPNTKKITVTLQYYQGHATTTQTMNTYITNLYGN